MSNNINTEDIKNCIEAGVPIVPSQVERTKKEKKIINNMFSKDAAKLIKTLNKSVSFEFWIADYGSYLRVGIGAAQTGFHLEEENVYPNDESLSIQTCSNSTALITGAELFFTEFDDTMYPDEDDTKNLCNIDLKEYFEYPKLKALTKRSYDAIKQIFLSGELVIESNPFPTHIPNSTLMKDYKENNSSIEIQLDKSSEAKIILEIPIICTSPKKLRYTLKRKGDFPIEKEFYFIWTGIGVIRYKESTTLGFISNPKNYENIRNELSPSEDRQPMTFDTEEIMPEEELNHSKPISEITPLWDKSNEDTQAMQASQLLESFSNELSNSQKQKEEIEKRLKNSNKIVVVNILFILSFVIFLLILLILGIY